MCAKFESDESKPMKTKYLFLGMGALLALGGLWFGRAAWRAHQQIVTLDVHKVPLADVLCKIERQTWRKICAEKNLDARITLRVTDKPLAFVLDWIGEQAGARWSTVYAVYDSARALNSLDTALRSDGQLEPAGWTKLAPTPQDSKPPDADEQRFVLRQVPNSGPPGPPAALHGGMMFQRSGNGAMVIQNGNGQKEVWSPEELVMESALHPRLGGDPIEEATPATAAEAASKIKGHWTTYLAFRKSMMGMGFGRVPPPGKGPGEFKHDPNERFARLTPEQRVQRARERMKMKQLINEDINQK
jgi:hypothetical protein